MKNSLSEIPALAARLLAQVSSSSGSSIVVRICHNYGLFERLLPKNTYFSANCMLRMLMPAADRADHAECVRHTGWFRILNAPNAARLNHAGIGLLGFGLISSHSRQTLLVVVFLSRDSYGAVREPEHRSYTGPRHYCRGSEWNVTRSVWLCTAGFGPLAPTSGCLGFPSWNPAAAIPAD